jgi:hypothetical protein
MPDYSKHWWYIERPFPWLGVAAIPFALKDSNPT